MYNYAFICVKTVSTLWTKGGNSCDSLYTLVTFPALNLRDYVVKSQLWHSFMQSYTSAESTGKFTYFNLLNRDLCPQSTAPIIKTMKEIN